MRLKQMTQEEALWAIAVKARQYKGDVLITCRDTHVLFLACDSARKAGVVLTDKAAYAFAGKCTVPWYVFKESLLRYEGKVQESRDDFGGVLDTFLQEAGGVCKWRPNVGEYPTEKEMLDLAYDMWEEGDPCEVCGESIRKCGWCDEHHHDWAIFTNCLFATAADDCESMMDDIRREEEEEVGEMLHDSKKDMGEES